MSAVSVHSFSMNCHILSDCFPDGFSRPSSSIQDKHSSCPFLESRTKRSNEPAVLLTPSSSTFHWRKKDYLFALVCSFNTSSRFLTASPTSSFFGANTIFFTGILSFRFSFCLALDEASTISPDNCSSVSPSSVLMNPLLSRPVAHVNAFRRFGSTFAQGSGTSPQKCGEQKVR